MNMSLINGFFFAVLSDMFIFMNKKILYAVLKTNIYFFNTIYYYVYSEHYLYILQ